VKLRRAAYACLLAGVLWLPAAGAGKGDASAAPDYAALKARLLAGDTGIDFRALRLAHAASPDYRPDSPNGLLRRKRVQDALEARRFADAVPLLERWLAADFLNPFAHLGAARVYRETGEETKAAFHDAVVDGIFASICAGDEGQSERRPCPVLSIDEQHFFLVMHDFMIDGEYGTVCAEGRPCEVYEVTKRNTNERYTLYFDISRPLAARDARRSAAQKE
jgi:hypothetical protein